MTLDGDQLTFLCRSVQASFHHITSHRVDGCRPIGLSLYPMNNLMYIKSITTHSLKLQYYGFRCHGDLPCNCTLHFGQTTYLSRRCLKVLTVFEDTI